MSPDYTIIVQGDTFLLSEAQLLLDSPNLFTKYFLGETSESEPRALRISRNPQLFSLIHEHLCGYIILPIHENALPARMSRETALKNLRADAVYYGLEKLVKLIDVSGQTSPASNAQGTLERRNAAAKKAEKPPSFFSFSGPGIKLRRYVVQPPIGFRGISTLYRLIDELYYASVCWYRALSNEGWHTLISLEAPLAPRPLLYISISPERDFRFELGIGDQSSSLKPGPSTTDPDRLSSGQSSSEVPLNVWTHLTFTQHVEGNTVTKRVLYSNGKELVSSDCNIHIYNPAPAQASIEPNILFHTRMALMRGSWDQRRSAGFIGQVEDVSVFQRVLDQDEIMTRASKVNVPADHGWPSQGSWDPLNDNVY